MKGEIRKEPLGLKHRELLYEKLRAVETPVSEYSFANLFLFRREHAYEVVFDREVFISGLTYDGRRYLMPTVDIKGLDMDYIYAMLEGYDFLYPVPEDRLALFPGKLFITVFREGDSDYVFQTEKLRTYAGRRLHRKRNLLKHFREDYRHSAWPLTPERVPDALKVLEAWQDASGQDKEDTDYKACRDGLRCAEEMLLCGGIFYADGKPAGFVLGEERPQETYVLHFAKGLVEYKGIYQYMFNMFASVLPDKYRYVNLEQDLDIEALRASKSSYQPDMMVRKARVARV